MHCAGSICRGTPSYVYPTRSTASHRCSVRSAKAVKVRACSSTYSSSGESHTCKDIELPNGTWWLDKATHSQDVVYGQNFVLHRPPRGGPGLVLSPRIHHLQIVREGQVTGLTVLPAAAYSRGLARTNITQLPWEVEADDYHLSSMDDEMSVPSHRLLPGPAPPASTSTGIILHSSSVSRRDSETKEEPHHPRRRQRVRFTCKLCGETTTKPVNPHAWTDGSVFARCDGCHVIHKLTDNLKLFHDLKGPVFNTMTAQQAANIKIPPGLPQKPGMTHHSHPGAWRQPEQED